MQIFWCADWLVDSERPAAIARFSDPARTAPGIAAYRLSPKKLRTARMTTTRPTI